MFLSGLNGRLNKIFLFLLLKVKLNLLFNLESKILFFFKMW